LFSKKSTQAINIIAGVSLIGFAVGVFAMIVVLSTMNGFEKLVFGMYNDFTPSIRVEPLKGKVIGYNTDLEDELSQIEGATFSRTLEENASCQYGDFQYIARIKGVEPAYIEQAAIENHLTDGEVPSFKSEDSAYALLGLGVDYRLGTRVEDPNCIVQMNAPRRGDYSINSLEAIQQKSVRPVGVIAYDDAINSKYILVPLITAQSLFEHEGEISSYEIYLKDEKNQSQVIAQLESKWANTYSIKTRYRLHEGLYKMFKTEKWFTFIILAFVLLIVSFNLTGSLALLVIEKKQDIKLMKSIGMKSTQVRQIFFNEGLLISAIGALIGLVSGLAFCYAQIHFGFIKISGAIVESYPMHVALIDVILCLVSVLVIGVLASIYPAFKASKYHA